VRHVPASASDAQQRVVAAYALGYTRQSDEQIAALVRASHDADDTVRNSAIRALGVLAESNPKVAGRIPAAGFIEMLSSGSWTDRNKAGFLLETLSQRRDPQLLGQLRAQALDALLEMARWRSRGHADFARIPLGRITGIEENRLQQLVQAGQVDAIINALPGTR
jgi:HEAT repeat protein